MVKALTDWLGITTTSSSASGGGGGGGGGGHHGSSRSAPAAWPRPSGGSPPARVRGGLLRQLFGELRAVLLGSKMNVLLLLLPAAVVSSSAGWPAGATFVLSMLPLCSLAERLGMVTEQLAMFTNDTVGGLLNATFGNATEVIIAAIAIRKGYLRVVKLTLLGSVISNLLLVMGSAFIVGGARYKEQRFSRQGVAINLGLLIVSVIAIALPTLLSTTDDAVTDATAELRLSRFESAIMLLGYGLFLVFQLCTHRHLYEEEEDAEDGLGGGGADAAAAKKKRDPSHVLPATSRGGANGDAGAATTLLRGGGGSGGLELIARSSASGAAAAVGGGGQRLGGSGDIEAARGGSGALRVEVAALAALESDGDGDEGERVGLVSRGVGGERSDGVLKFEVEDGGDDERVLSLPSALLWLALITLLISVLSDYVMDTVRDASLQLGVPMPFLATIVVPIVGNAAEHASALLFASRNRMEIALGVAVGSATQVAVLLVPFCVLLAATMRQPLDLNFNEFEALVLFVAVLLAVVVLQDGTANWLKGAMLVFTYFFIAAGFWVHKDPDLNADEL